MKDNRITEIETCLFCFQYCVSFVSSTAAKPVILLSAAGHSGASDPPFYGGTLRCERSSFLRRDTQVRAILLSAVGHSGASDPPFYGGTLRCERSSFLRRDTQVRAILLSTAGHSGASDPPFCSGTLRCEQSSFLRWDTQVRAILLSAAGHSGASDPPFYGGTLRCERSSFQTNFPVMEKDVVCPILQINSFLFGPNLYRNLQALKLEKRKLSKFLTYLGQ